MSLNNILRDNNIIKYYGGNEKVKLEYKKGNQNQIILINNYLNNKQFKHDIYILNNSQPKDLYKDLLSKSVNLKSKKIIPLTQYKEQNSISNDQKILNDKSICLSFFI